MRPGSTARRRGAPVWAGVDDGHSDSTPAWRAASGGSQGFPCRFLNASVAPGIVARRFGALATLCGPTVTAG